MAGRKKYRPDWPVSQATALACTSADSAAASVRLALGIILVGAGSLKLWRPRETVDAVNQLWKGVKHTPVLVRCIAALECLCGLWLWSGYRAEIASAMASAVLGVFCVYAGVLLRQGFKGSCACFGALDSEEFGPLQFFRNIVLFGSAAVVAGEGFLSACRSQSGHALSWPLQLLAFVEVAVAAIIYALISTMVTAAHAHKRYAASLEVS